VEVEKIRRSLAPASDGISRPAAGVDDTPAEAMEIAEEVEVLIPSPEETSDDLRVSASRGASALSPGDWERIGDLVRGEVRRVLGDSSLRRPSPPFISGEKEGVSWANVVSSGGPTRPRKRKRRKVTGGGNGDAVDTSSPLLWTRGWERHLLGKQFLIEGGKVRLLAPGLGWGAAGHLDATGVSSLGMSGLGALRRCPGGICYRCGSPGHKMLGCRTLPNCPVCRDLKAPTTDHSLGEGNFCSSIGGVVSVGGSGGDNSSSATREGFPRDSSGKPERVKKGVG